MNNLSLEVKRTRSGIVPHGGNVLFTERSPFSSGIPYNELTGVVGFDAPGQYLVRWWVATGTTLTGIIRFDLILSKDGDVIDTISGISPIKTGQVSGFGVINVEDPDGTTLSLVNASDNDVVFSSKAPVTAYLLITQNPASSSEPYEPAYGTFVSIGAKTLPEGSDVPFDTTLAIQPVGITFDPGSTFVTVANAGIYRVSYEISSSGTVRYGLLINGILLPNSEISSSLINLSGKATVALTEGATLGIGILNGDAMLRIFTSGLLDVLRIQ